MKRLWLRVVFPIVASSLFATLSVARTRQAHIIDHEGWGLTPGIEVSEEEGDMGTPADVLLLAFNLPALIALLPLSPLAHWVDSETVLRAIWGVASAGQWFLIGRYFDRRRGTVPAGEANRRVWLNKLLFLAMMIPGALLLGVGVYGTAIGHDSFWAFAIYASFIFWGLTFVISAVRWRSSSSWAQEHFNTLRLS